MHLARIGRQGCWREFDRVYSFWHWPKEEKAAHCLKKTIHTHTHDLINKSESGASRRKVKWLFACIGGTEFRSYMCMWVRGGVEGGADRDRSHPGVASRAEKVNQGTLHLHARWRWTARNATTPGAIQREREREREKKKAACAYACGGDSLSRSLGNIREYDDVTTGRLEPCEWGPGFAAEVYKVAGRALDDISTWREKCRSTAPALHSRILRAPYTRLWRTKGSRRRSTWGPSYWWAPALDFLHLHAASAA